MSAILLNAHLSIPNETIIGADTTVAWAILDKHSQRSMRAPVASCQLTLALKSGRLARPSNGAFT